MPIQPAASIADPKNHPPIDRIISVFPNSLYRVVQALRTFRHQKHAKQRSGILSRKAISPASARRTTVVIIVIGSFAVIFLTGIIWATSRRADEPRH
jgi:hypothetical protein